MALKSHLFGGSRGLAACEINDAAHFSRSFKRRFGHSPSAFRASAGHGTDLPQPEG